jgi:hypothetical protein
MTQGPGSKVFRISEDDAGTEKGDAGGNESSAKWSPFALAGARAAGVRRRMRAESISDMELKSPTMARTPETSLGTPILHRVCACAGLCLCRR